MTIPKPGDIADRLVREHADLPHYETVRDAVRFGGATQALREAQLQEKADRIADTVTRVKAVWPCVEFTLCCDELTADIVRLRCGTYRVLGVVMQYDAQAWSVPETDLQRSIVRATEAYCRAHDAEIRLAIDAHLAPDVGDGTGERYEVAGNDDSTHFVATTDTEPFLRGEGCTPTEAMSRLCEAIAGDGTNHDSLDADWRD